MMMGDMLFNTKYKPSEYLDMATSWIPDQFNFTDPVRQMFSSLPQFLKPAVETGMGKRTFPKVIPIETMGDKNLPPEFRYNIHTAEMYKQIGKLFKISPKLSEHLIRGYLGRFTDLFSGRGYKNPIKKEWYFTSGRRLVEYYNYREKVSQGKSAYRKGLVDGFEERNLAYIKGIDKRLKVYRDVEQSYLKAKKEKNKKLEAKKMDEMDSWRTEILDLIDKMEI